MRMYTGLQYIMIDIANNYHENLDKKTFEERIEWVQANSERLEELSHTKEWKDKPLYQKAVSAFRKAQRGIPTGHMVGFDAVCSGMQLMSVLTGCIDGARATGLVDPDRRADAYATCTQEMSKILGYHMINERKRVKNACMTRLYGSREEPKKEFGEDTPELDAFYKAMYKMAPGPCELLDDLLESWQPYALEHAWTLPDGFRAKVKVMQKKEHRIEVDELQHATFTYTFYENEGEKKGVKNAANVIHSIDAYVLRSLVRRCSYNQAELVRASKAIQIELLTRNMDDYEPPEVVPEGMAWNEVLYYVEHYDRSGMPDAVIFPWLNADTVQLLSTEHLQKLMPIATSMLQHRPFPIITVHDDFKCHPNNMNWLRIHYRNILAEMADSHLMQDLLNQIHGGQGTYIKKSQDLSKYIMESNYALT